MIFDRVEAVWTPNPPSLPHRIKGEGSGGLTRNPFDVDLIHTEPTIEVAAGLVFRGGKLLITQRPPGTHLAGLWEFPGGKREADESMEACLKRELLEEAGIEVAVGGLVESMTHSYPEKTVHIQFFRCQWLRHEPRPLGCADCKWIEPNALDTYAFPPADARLLDLLRSHPEWWRDSGAA